MTKNRRIYSVFRVLFEDDSLPNPNTNIDTRLKLQKIAYLVQEVIGIPLNIEFNMRLYGPYSPQLADIYVKETFMEDLRNTTVCPEIDEIREILYKLKEKDPRWLEIVTTFYSIRKEMKQDYDALKSVARTKSVKTEHVQKFVNEAEEILKK